MSAPVDRLTQVKPTKASKIPMILELFAGQIDHHSYL